MKYLKNIQTLEELKKAYHAWALKIHPDRGGDVEEMKILNAEYEKIFEKVKDIHINMKGETYQKSTEETPEEFQDLINKLLKISGIQIEVIGCFVWVSGNTKPYKEKLKALGMKWHSKKKMWYLSPKGYKRFGKKSYSIDEIRSMYGSRKYKGKKEEEKRLAAQA